MKNLRYLLACVALMAVTISLSAKDDEKYVDPYEDYDEFVFMDMSLDDNIDAPKVSKKEHKSVKNYMEKLKNRLQKDKYELELTRDDEVVIVVLPTDDLFLPNDTQLTDYGVRRLSPLLRYMQDPDMFKIVYSVHTDDTGSISYLSALSESRLNSIYGWMTDNNRVPDDLVIIPYAMGDRDHIADNNTRANRAKNRRLELYFIPGPKMIQQAHEGKLKFEF